MSLFTTLTTENIHWALNANLEILYREMGYKVPTSGLVEMLGDINANTKFVRNPHNYGEASAWTLAGLDGVAIASDVDVGLNEHSISITDLASYESFLPGIIRTTADGLVAEAKLRIDEFRTAYVNPGTAGGTTSLTGTAPIRKNKIPSITVAGMTWDSPLYFYEPGTGNSLSLTYAVPPVAADFTLSFWLKETRSSAVNSDGSWSAWARIVHGLSATRYADVSTDLGVTAIWHDGTTPRRIACSIPSILNNRYQDALGPPAGDKWNGPKCGSSVFDANNESLQHWVVRYTGGVLEIIQNLTKVTVYPEVQTTSYTAPTAGTFKFTPGPSFSNQFKNAQVAGMKMWDRALADYEIGVMFLGRV